MEGEPYDGNLDGLASTSAGKRKKSSKKERSKKTGADQKAERHERRERRKKRKTKSSGDVLDQVSAVSHVKTTRVRSCTLATEGAKERKIESAVRLWATSSTGALDLEPKHDTPVSETVLNESPFPGIPVFSEEDKDLEKRTEVKELLKIENAFHSWAGDTEKPRIRRSLSVGLGSLSPFRKKPS